MYAWVHTVIGMPQGTPGPWKRKQLISNVAEVLCEQATIKSVVPNKPSTDSGEQ